MTKDQRPEAINEAWDGMKESQKGMEIARSTFHNAIFSMLYKMFWILYQLLFESRKKESEE